jgi:hypothetical protein
VYVEANITALLDTVVVSGQLASPFFMEAVTRLTAGASAVLLFQNQVGAFVASAP